MTSIVCPLCGKHSPKGSFHPENLEDDICEVELHGLGRGRGFEVSERSSILNSDSSNDVIDRIASRVLRLVMLLKENGTITEAQIQKLLGRKEKEEFTEMESRAENLDNDARELAQEIAGVLGDDIDDWESDPDGEDESSGPSFILLKYGVRKVLSEFESLKASNE